jgi:hypothetical protein
MNREAIEARLKSLKQQYLMLVEAEASKGDDSGRLKFNAGMYSNVADIEAAIKNLEQELNK